jgi:hypothetical protein
VLNAFFFEQGNHIRHHKFELFLLLVLINESIEDKCKDTDQKNEEDHCPQNTAIDEDAKICLICEYGPEGYYDDIRQHYEDPESNHNYRRDKAKDLLRICFDGLNRNQDK